MSLNEVGEYVYSNSAHRRDKKCTQNFKLHPIGKRLLGRPKRGWIVVYWDRL